MQIHAQRFAVAALAALCLASSIDAQQPPPAKPDHMQHRFDDPERFAKSFDDPARDAWQMPNRVIEALGLRRNSLVADVGAGTGYFSVRLAKAVPAGTVYAVDIEPAMLEHIGKRATTEKLTNVVPVQAGTNSTNLPKPVDVVLIVDTYHHLPNRSTYFADLRKSLTANGRVAIVDFRKDSPEGPPRDFRFEAEQIIGEMKNAGYELETRHDFLPRQHFLVFRPAARPAEVASSVIDTLLRTAVEQQRVPMVVAMVADAKGVVYEHASGVSKDAIFAMASMTKPITSLAVMQLVEAGKVKLDEPAATYVRELGTVRVLDGGTLRAPKTPITVRHLLTHTAGFGYEFLNRDLFGLVAKKELASVMAGGDAFLNAPLVFDPGTMWEYGISTDWLGRLVERVSGQSLDAYFRERVFEPLGMSDSYFNVPAEKQARMVRIFQRTEEGKLAEPPPMPTTKVEFFSGGGGLYSTAADYMKFVRALMAGGQLGGRRILSARSVDEMATNQIGALMIRELPSVIPQLASTTAVMPGSVDKFGLGFALNSKPIAGGRAANTISWAGIYNTFFWIDREKQVAAVLLTQMLPFLDAGPTKLLEDFNRAVYLNRQ